ncbi:PEGA domain-containing protein [Aeromicrobium sp.]|nr:PEGA domain-containing protein [Candidatus Saccharibacteria bacterium]
MDFLDPKKRQRRDMFNIIGYGLIAIALVFAVRILFYQASGFGIDKNGKVTQSGLLFVASSPGGAQVRINGVLDKAQTDARLSLVSGTYNVKYSRDGYNNWQQTTNVEGGKIVRLDYATLFPKKLVTNAVKKYEGAVGLSTQSPDRRWLLVQKPGSDNVFDQYDLKNPKFPSTELTVPATVISNGASDSWTLGEWSNDNEHVLMNHTHDGVSEFVLLDRSDMTKSVNLNTAFAVTPTKVSLVDKKFDRFYVYDAAAQTLKTARLDAPAPQTYLSDVLEYQSYSDNVMLYASSKTTTPGKVGVVLLLGGKSYFLREVSGNSTYLLNLTQYNREWYVAIGAKSESKVYVYKNPNTQLTSNLGQLVPISVLKTTTPNRLSFSSNARFIMAENGSQFGVYDAEVNKSYQYDTKLPLDPPQAYANWMDGTRLAYSSGSKLVVFDFDNTNLQTLAAMDAQHTPFFVPDYKYMYSLAPAESGSQALTSTALRTPADL